MFSKKSFAIIDWPIQDPEAIDIIYNSIIELIPPSKSTKDDALVLSYKGLIISEPFQHDERIIIRVYTDNREKCESIVISLSPYFIRSDEGSKKFLDNEEINKLKEVCLKSKDKTLATPEQIEILNHAFNERFPKNELAKLTSYAVEEMILNKPGCLEALADGFIRISNFINRHPSYLYFLTEPCCLNALREGIFTAEILDFIFDSHALQALQSPNMLQALNEQIFTLREILELNFDYKLIWRIASQKCLDKMRAGLISLYAISRLNITPIVLEQVINTNKPKRYLDALEEGLFSIKEMDDVISRPVIDAILTNGCLQGLREKLFTVSDIKNLSFEKIKKISSLTGLEVLRSGFLNLETMLEMSQVELEELLKNVYYSSVIKI
ncbi:MAG: hypothetical protein H0U57_05445 [Tatlockia sp.]|nr:hypothetical protein [Tatlockia sp.]